MKRLFLLMFLFSGCSVLSPLQKSKFIAVSHLIEVNNFEEAKVLVDELVNDQESAKWPRSWYVQGLLSQDAYRDGMRRNDKNKFEMYPDQLYLAYESFEKARELDKKGRYDKQLAPRYVLLANDFQRMGERHFTAKKYDEALRAFQQALIITQSPILSMRSDHDLIYNTAIAAYEAGKKDKALELLTQLDDYNYSPNVAHLLFTTHLEKGDTLAAEKVLLTGIDKYDNNENLVLLLADLLNQRGHWGRAIRVLDRAALKSPAAHVYPYTQGLIHHKRGHYNRAIEAYEKAFVLAPNETIIPTNIATCYYNIGVEIEENARNINNSRIVQEEREKSAAAFASAVKWLDKAYEKESRNQAVNMKLYQLYRALSENEKARSVQGRIH